MKSSSGTSRKKIINALVALCLVALSFTAGYLVHRSGIYWTILSEFSKGTTDLETTAESDKKHSNKAWAAINRQNARTLSNFAPQEVAERIKFRMVHESVTDLSPTVLDINRDGLLDAGNIIQRENQRMERVSLATLGIPVDLEKSSYLYYADLNNDHFEDLVIGRKIYSTVIPASQTDRPVLVLLGSETGTYQLSDAFEKLNIICYNEQVVFADFDNDQDNDIFLTGSHIYESHNFLLINDGHGNFSERADVAGVAMRNNPLEYRGEGAQAVDINADGLLDLYVGSRFFINQGNLTFMDQREALGLPLIFDEGVNFSDLDKDGMVDIILFAPLEGPRVFLRVGDRFKENKEMVPSFDYTYSGMNVYDINNDGFEDILSGNDVEYTSGPPPILLGSSEGFSLVVSESFIDYPNHKYSVSGSFGDFNNDGRIDFTRRLKTFGKGELGEPDERYTSLTQVYLNESQTDGIGFSVEVVGVSGLRNQHGRRVIARPVNNDPFLITRFVDGGSGYLTQNQYPVLFGSPYDTTHTVTVFFADESIEFKIEPGEKKRVYRGGKVELMD